MYIVSRTAPSNACHGYDDHCASLPKNTIHSTTLLVIESCLPETRRLARRHQHSLCMLETPTLLTGHHATPLSRHTPSSRKNSKTASCSCCPSAGSSDSKTWHPSSRRDVLRVAVRPDTFCTIVHMHPRHADDPSRITPTPETSPLTLAMWIYVYFVTVENIRYDLLVARLGFQVCFECYSMQSPEQLHN